MTKSQLKRRLVGAAVLASLAVIFVPMMLDNRSEVAVGPVIPDRSAGPFNERLAAEVPEPIRRTTPVEPVAAPARPEPAPAAANPNVLPAPAAGETSAPAAGPQGWVVQVGSFGESGNAEGLAKRLRAAGFDTVIESAQVQGATVYRVQVGPTADENAATDLRSQIQAKLQLDGKVVRHPPG